jgi:hypothetical protein
VYSCRHICARPVFGQICKGTSSRHFGPALSPPGERAGFFLGDGAGVGKGRQIAGLIKEFWATGGRRVLWVSTSSDLRYDARRDLHDVHGKGSHHWIHVHPKVRHSCRAGGQAPY